MYILIDRQQMAIVHKHSDRAVLGKLSWIECTNAGVTLPLTNARALSEFSATELRLLYKNATGAELKGYGNMLCQAVFEMAKRLPESDVVPDEVFTQALCIADGDKSCYSYAKGAQRPTVHNGLYEPAVITVERKEAEEALGNQGSAPYAPVYGSAAGGGAGHTHPGANGTGAPTQPRAPAAPRTGGARETIFKVADEMWAAAGSPRELPRVLALRKEIMGALESEHGIKKTTSSTALGDWQKSRLA